MGKAVERFFAWAATASQALDLATLYQPVEGPVDRSRFQSVFARIAAASVGVVSVEGAVAHD